MDRLRFLHIPKTAGSTFNLCLDYQYFGKRQFAFTGIIENDIDCYMGLSEHERQKIVLFSGHAPLLTGIEEADHARTVTFLRDPISRVKSFVQHISEGKSPEYLTGPFDLDVFLASGFGDLSNLQTKMLINSGSCTSSSLLDTMSKAEARDAALNNLYNVISEFGIQEYFDESLILFARALNWSTPFYTSVNKKNTSRLVAFKPHHIEHLAELNSIDIEVYNTAKTMFLNKLEGAEFDRTKLACLKQVNLSNSPRKIVWHAWYAFYRLKRRIRRRFGDVSS